MAPPEPYRGPVALATSKYASPQSRVQYGAAPMAITSPTPKATLNNTIATMDQVAATGNAVQAMGATNSASSLAIAQSKALKTEVEAHTAQITQSVANAVANTHELLTKIRESVAKNGPEGERNLATLDALWKELEQLFRAAQAAKAALPEFLTKQKENMSLYHSTVVNETMRETQDELNLQHKKVNLQHSLILENQQAFQDYKAKTEAKLKDLAELQERVSRLTLDKGSLSAELDKAQVELTTFRSTEADGVKKTEELNKEIETLMASKKDISDEADTLRKAVSELQDKLTAEKTKAADFYEKEIRRVSEQLGKEQQKVSGLDALVKALQSGDGKAKKEAEDAKKEINNLKGKMEKQINEYTRLTENLTARSLKIDSLNAVVARLDKENTELKKQVQQLDELKKQLAALSHAKAELQTQCEKLQGDLHSTKEESDRAKKDAAKVSDKLKEAERNYEELEMENNDLVANAAEAKQVSRELASVKEEKAKLLSTIQDLQSKKPSNEGGVSAAELAELKANLEKVEAENADLNKTVLEWKNLAERTYKEYQTLMPYRQKVEELGECMEKKDAEIQALTTQLNAPGKHTQVNGPGGDHDAGYWRRRYESLLEELN